MFARWVHVVMELVVCPCSLLYSLPLLWVDHTSSIMLLMGIWVIFYLRLLRIILLWTFLCISSDGYMQSFLLGIYPRMQLFNHGSRHMINCVNHASSPIYASPVVNATSLTSHGTPHLFHRSHADYWLTFYGPHWDEGLGVECLLCAKPWQGTRNDRYQDPCPREFHRVGVEASVSSQRLKVNVFILLFGPKDMWTLVFGVQLCSSNITGNKHLHPSI